MTQTVARGPGGPRSQVALPAQGMEELRDLLTELLEAFGQDDDGSGSLSVLLSGSRITSEQPLRRRREDWKPLSVRFGLMFHANIVKIGNSHNL